MMDKSIITILVSTFVCVTSFDASNSYVMSIEIKDSKVVAVKYKFSDKVKVDFFYESLCPGSIQEYSTNLPPVIHKLSDYVDISTYPYGNARMHEDNGTVVVKCQHGEAECYGNKLHACAIDLLNDVQKYVDYNACMMENHSNDDAADSCGKSQNVDSGPIKTCAKGARGQDLLIKYGHETESRNINFVPYILINGQLKPDDKELWKAVCDAIPNPPQDCQG